MQATKTVASNEADSDSKKTEDLQGQEEESWRSSVFLLSESASLLVTVLKKGQDKEDGPMERRQSQPSRAAKARASTSNRRAAVSSSTPAAHCSSEEASDAVTMPSESRAKKEKEKKKGPSRGKAATVKVTNKADSPASKKNKEAAVSATEEASDVAKPTPSGRAKKAKKTKKKTKERPRKTNETNKRAARQQAQKDRPRYHCAGISLPFL